jgi:hypothetical protein
LPGRKAWLKGLIWGVVVAVVGSWSLAPLTNGGVLGQPDQALFGGLDPRRMLSTIIIVGGFGLALGAIYGLLRPKQAQARPTGSQLGSRPARGLVDQSGLAPERRRMISRSTSSVSGPRLAR